MEFHTVKMKRYEKKRKNEEYYSAVLGSVVHPKENPDDYTVKILATGKVKVIIGNEGVYILDDILTEKVVEARWRNYLESYRNSPGRGKKSRRDKVIHPIEVREDFLREFLLKEGVCRCKTGFFDFSEERTPEVENILKAIKRIRKKVRSNNYKFNREELYEKA